VLHRIREMLKAQAPAMLEDIVQADETFVGGKNKNRHHNKKVKNDGGRSFKDKTPVLGLESNGKVITQVISTTRAQHIIPVITQKIVPGSTLVTDEWCGYNSAHKQFDHIIIDHARGQYVNEGFTTNTIEGFWSHLKRGLNGTYHCVSRKHLQRYCDEFAHRYNSRQQKDTERFQNMLCHLSGRLKYTQLIEKKGLISYGRGNFK
jgi:transposase-like protein